MTAKMSVDFREVGKRTREIRSFFARFSFDLSVDMISIIKNDSMNGQQPIRKPIIINLFSPGHRHFAKIYHQRNAIILFNVSTMILV